MLVIGGTGLIGSKLVNTLAQRGHEAVAASPATGVNTITGEGLAEALAGVQVVVDVANSPSFEDQAVLDFFETSGRNLLAAEAAAGIGHHVALSVVGTHRLAESGYFRGKIAQEKLITASGIPYTIVHSTQFFEFLGGIVQSGAEGDVVRLSPAYVQPIASDDVALAMADATLAPPVNGTVEIAGPERVRLATLVQRYLDETRDARKVVADGRARYFGALLQDDTLVPGTDPRLGKIGFDTWFRQSNAKNNPTSSGHTPS
ncbi:MAG TPA: SDR family oxidoreductase [Bordetella sp.]|nr:SDR family oxidoreductase [Bordetella sp.]